MATAPIDISLLEKQWHQTVMQWPEEQEVVVKIGALVQPSILTALPQWLDAVTSGVKLVVDPVLNASAGGRLQPEGYAAWLRKMAPRITVLTPNLLEAHALLGTDLISTDPWAWQRLGFNGVLLKGGHGHHAHVVEDCWLQSGEHCLTFSHQRLAGNRRGTGCFLATAIACQLALGKNVNRAISDAIYGLLRCWQVLPPVLG